jgi:hypothetical protein
MWRPRKPGKENTIDKKQAGYTKRIVETVIKEERGKKDGNNSNERWGVSAEEIGIEG